jgi:quercetin 2,3-dioxygenase
MNQATTAKSKTLIETAPLGFQWPCIDPFLFCVHHVDAYPAGNEQMGPAASLAGRDIGRDFDGKDGWRMYHGQTVPGFPQHPHRGFETVTIVRRGLIDHSDSLGAAARFGSGDVQWLTAGGGIVHSEMFPLLDRAAPNTAELFQIWLNLPAEDKMVPPHFTMLWDSDIPRVTHTDDAGLTTTITVVSGTLAGKRGPSPPPHSWASRADSDLAIWCVAMPAGAQWTLPAAEGTETVRALYFFNGKTIALDDHHQTSHACMLVRSDHAINLKAGAEPCELLLLQARPIAEPVAQHGPFVMNDRAGIEKAFQDYRRTQFGGWPWDRDDPVHAREEGRFARHADGRIERR